MSLTRLYQQRYGTAEEKRAAADPKERQEKIAAAEGGKIASGAFWDELGKLVEADQLALKEAADEMAPQEGVGSKIMKGLRGLNSLVGGKSRLGGTGFGLGQKPPSSAGTI